MGVWRGLLVGLLLAAGPGACAVISSYENSGDGPGVRICGTREGRAEQFQGDGPFYVDISHRSPTRPITAAAGTNGTWLRVSADCSHGDEVAVSNPGVLKILDVIAAPDGKDVAVYVAPAAVGRATVTATRANAEPQTVQVTVIPPPPAPTLPS